MEVSFIYSFSCDRSSVVKCLFNICKTPDSTSQHWNKTQHKDKEQGLCDLEKKKKNEKKNIGCLLELELWPSWQSACLASRASVQSSTLDENRHLSGGGRRANKFKAMLDNMVSSWPAWDSLRPCLKTRTNKQVKSSSPHISLTYLFPQDYTLSWYWRSEDHSPEFVHWRSFILKAPELSITSNSVSISSQ